MGKAFTASAGVILIPTEKGITLASLSRVSGGDPQSQLLALSSIKSFPRKRGCSPEVKQRLTSLCVFPVCAGGLLQKKSRSLKDAAQIWDLRGTTL